MENQVTPKRALKHVVNVAATANHELYRVHTRCPFCKLTSITLVPVDQWHAFCGGMRAQAALLSLPNDERELLMTGIDRQCWRRIGTDLGALP